MKKKIGPSLLHYIPMLKMLAFGISMNENYFMLGIFYFYVRNYVNSLCYPFLAWQYDSLPDSFFSPLAPAFIKSMAKPVMSSWKPTQWHHWIQMFLFLTHCFAMMEGFSLVWLRSCQICQKPVRYRRPV